MRIILAALLTILSCGSLWPQTPKTISMPPAQTIAAAVIWRLSDTKGDQGLLPPWKEVRVTNVFGFKKRPVVGRKVTIIPLDVDVAPFDLRIVKRTEQKECDDPELSSWWEVDLELVKDKRIFDIAPALNRAAEYPFEVAVIYPAVSFAKQIVKTQLKEEILPRRVLVSTVKAAIDLTNDGKPDALILEYCCDNPKRSLSECDYTCGKTFKKIRGVWKLIDTSAPC